MRVLIVPDKFKGTLTATEAAGAIAAGWKAARPFDEVESLPMSDGGEGFASVVGHLLGGERKVAYVEDAAHQPREAQWWFAADSQSAVVETAQSNGLALLPKGRFHPFQLDTFGVGLLLLEAAKAGARRCYAGVGGSATNDGGFGMARALGWRFWADDKSAIESWTDLHRLHAVEAPHQGLFEQVIVANDVQNPLLGPLGATRIFGPQKGVRPEDFELAERCLGRLAAVMAAVVGSDCATLPGAGAAGGLGFGVATFLGGQFKPGFELFAELSHLSGRIAASDLVISAEGGIDEQTAMGKGVGGVADLARKAGVPCIGLAGNLTITDPGKFTACYGVHPHLTTLEAAMNEPSRWLTELAGFAARKWPAL